jgi:hypothetical protein
MIVVMEKQDYSDELLLKMLWEKVGEKGGGN